MRRTCSVSAYTRNVERWRGGRMIVRWVSAALQEAEKAFRRVRGYPDMRQLVAALDLEHRAPVVGAVSTLILNTSAHINGETFHFWPA